MWLDQRDVKDAKYIEDLTKNSDCWRPGVQH